MPAIKRCRYIDIAKGLCIILVVIGHFNPDYAPRWWDVLNRIIYTFHMPVFLFASGFIFIYTRKPGLSYGRMLYGKVKRLMIPYFSTSVIVITIKLLSQGSLNVDNPVTIDSYLRIFYYPEAGYFLWFIWTLWWMFMAVGVYRNKTHLWLLTMLTLMLHFIPFQVTRLFALEATCYNAVYFMTGAMVCLYRDRLKRWRQVPPSFFCLLFVLMETGYAVLPPDSVWHRILVVIIPFAGIVAVTSLSRSIAAVPLRRVTWIYTVSACSYIIYLFHTTFEGFTKAIAVKIAGLPLSDMQFIGVATLVIAIGLTGPMVLQRYGLERWWVSRLLFGLKKREIS